MAYRGRNSGRSRRPRRRRQRIPIKRDVYGFRKEYDRVRDYTPKIRGYNLTNKKIKRGFMYFCIIILLFLIIISGSHAWSSYPDDMMLVRLFRLWLAVMFSPFYLFYVFSKKTVFKPA
jgi:cytochrome b subunit of formate dehydrogenase